MSCSPYFFLERRRPYPYNDFVLYHPMIENDENEIPRAEYADLFNWNDYDVFNIVENKYSDSFPELHGIHYLNSLEDIKHNISDYVYSEYINCCDCEDFKIPLYTVDVANLIIYSLKYSTVKNDEGEIIPNPINRFLDRIKAFLEVMNENWEDHLIDYRIVYWFVY